MATNDKKAVRRPLPLLCRNYNKKCGCSRESCEDLHMCYYFLCRNCTNENCTRAHSLDTPRNIVRLEELGFYGPEGIELAIENMQRKLHGITLTLCYSYNSGACEATDCRRLHVCHRHVLDGCPLEDCDLSHSVTTGQHNICILKAAGLADEPVAKLMRHLAEELTKRPLKPATCRHFYDSPAGCEGRCLRLHCCPAFARGNCWYGDRCFKRHSLRDLHNQRVLRFYGCTESQALATYASRYGGANDGEVGSGNVIESPSAEAKTPLVRGDLEDIETAWSSGKRERKGYDNPEETRGQGNDEGSSPEIGTGENRSDRPAEVQRLIDYLEQYRERKTQRDQQRKERQERLRRVVDRKEREDREVERIRRELQEKKRQEKEIKVGKENHREEVLEEEIRREAREHGERALEKYTAEIEDNPQQPVSMQSRLHEFEQLEERERSTRDLARFRELASKQREYMKCSVCRGVLTRPVVLSCSHMFCQACIASTKLHAETCPLCFLPIYAKTRCFVLDKLAGSITDMEEI